MAGVTIGVATLVCPLTPVFVTLGKVAFAIPYMTAAEAATVAAGAVGGGLAYEETRRR